MQKQQLADATTKRLRQIEDDVLEGEMLRQKAAEVPVAEASSVGRAGAGGRVWVLPVLLVAVSSCSVGSGACAVESFAIWTINHENEKKRQESH